jgi:streptogramin lyase
VRTSFASRSLAACFRSAVSFGVSTSSNNAEAARQRRGGLWAPAATVWATAGRLSLGALLLGGLAQCPLQSQTAYFGGAVTTLGGGFFAPWGVAVDGSGNVYVADSDNNAVKEMPAGCASSSCVTTLVGGFSFPEGVAVDKSGNVYVGVSEANAVKEIPAGCASSSCVTTLGGGFSNPSFVAVDGAGNVYVADSYNNAVKEMPPGCASSSCVTTLGGGFNGPAGVAVDGSGNVYVGDTLNDLVKEMPPGCTSANYTNNLCTITTLGGGFSGPRGVTVDGSGNVYVADWLNNAVKEMPPGCASSSCVTTLGGGFGYPESTAVDGSGNVYVADSANYAVYEIMPHGVSFGTVAVGTSGPALTLYFTFTAADSGITASVLTQGAKGLDFADAGGGSCDTNGTSYAYSAGNTCTVNVTFAPKYAGARYGAVVLSDANGAIATAYIYGTGQGPQLVFPSNPTIQTLGGTFYYPWGVAVDGSGNVYVGGGTSTGLHEMPAGCASSSCVTTLAFFLASGVAVDGSGNIYETDAGNNAVREMPPGCASSSCVTTLGGGFDYPFGIAVDGSGNVYVADWQNNAVKEMPPGCASSSCVTTLGGGFNYAQGVAVDSNGNVYVGDTNNNLVKEMPPGCTAANYTNNLCTTTTLGGGFNTPQGLRVDGSGNVYVADANNYAVKEIPSGCASSSCVTTLRSGFITPLDVALDGSGNVYVPVYNVAGAVYELDFASSPSLSFAATSVGSQSSDSPRTATLENIGNAPLSFPDPLTGENPSVSANFTLDASTTCPEVLSSSSVGTLAAGASCNLAVDFIPTTTGPITGAVVLTDSNLNANPAVTQSIALSGTGETGLPMPIITWATPAAITYGTALSGTQLDATASYNGAKVAGTFTYTPAKGTVLGAGMETLSVVFTPTKTTTYSPVGASVVLQVNPAATKVSWNKPAAIMYGTGLSSTQLDATASVPGTFTYSPIAGTVLTAGTQTLSVTFAPTESTDYLGSTDSVTITVNKAAPVLTWATPAAISYGTALSGTQLDATASVSGTFVYSPAAGAVLAAGTQTLSVTFTPTGTTDYTTAKASVSLEVTSSTPTLTWATPAAITYGTALSATQLDATATYNGAKVAGTFAYSPAKGTVLGAGAQTLSVLFTPSNTSDYSPISASVTLQVNQATPKITWAKPAAIVYGTALSSTQLDATASVPGAFTYTPDAGTVLAEGTQTLSVLFTPTDTADYTTQTATTTITVKP